MTPFLQPPLAFKAAAPTKREPKRLGHEETTRIERHVFAVALNVGSLSPALVGISRRLAKGATNADLLLELSTILDSLDTARAEIIKATVIAWSLPPELDQKQEGVQ